MRFIQETWLTFVRAFRPALRSPGALIAGALVPLLYLVLFGPLLGQTKAAEGVGSWQWFVPGMLIQLTLFITVNAGFTLIPDTRSGVLERMRVTPVSRVALLLGRVMKDVVLLLVQAAMLVALAVALGFRAPVLPMVVAFAMLAIVGVAVGFISYGLAMKLKHEFLLAPVVSGLAVPVMLLSGVLLPMDFGPAWLYAISRANPLTHVVDAERAIVAGDLTSTTVLVGAAVAVGLFVLSMGWAVRTFRKEYA
ncbi:ABC transporter permease [Nonomuraea sp. NBC_01738]|uniref:ABC transporter permease n=1 Tax=Nonomuraea sp. NBC_01738 TaxID=2976003 RepID=UPI002E10589A|nr:ABC transporter permease [Nonomuraea sp. NBC_01738]